MGVTTEITEFLDHAAHSLAALDRVSAQVEITLVDTRELVRALTRLTRALTTLLEHGIGPVREV